MVDKKGRKGETAEVVSDGWVVQLGLEHLPIFKTSPKQLLPQTQRPS